MSATTRDDFELWLVRMDDELEALKMQVPRKLRANLDFSIASLRKLEAWILANYATIESLVRDEEGMVLDRLARYIGETLRKATKGKWDIELTNKKDAYFRLPVVVSAAGVECPVTLATASVDRRTGKYLEGVIAHLAQSA